MKDCNAVVFLVLSSLSLAGAVNLRHKIADNEAHPEYKLTLQNYKGVQYFAPITLNDQKMWAVYDTGSFEIMAMSKACAVCHIPSSYIKYDNTSSTFVKGNGPMTNHHFAGGLVVGRQDLETIHIGDVGKGFATKNMPFWQVMHTEMKVWLAGQAQFTAIVGLGHREAHAQATSASLLERTGTSRFAICLQKGASNPGYIYFNPTSTATFTSTGGSGVYRKIPVIGKNHWAVTMDAASTSMGGTVTDTRCGVGQACVAIIDSGTSLIGVPQMAVPMISALAKKIKPDCSNMDQLPELTFTLAGQKFVMPASAYVIRFKVSPTLTKCLPAFTDFNMMSSHGNMWILGMPFLRHFYTVFDRTEPAIYVADQGENCQPVAHNSTASFSTFPKARQEPAFADTSEATLPSWAYGNSIMDI